MWSRKGPGFKVWLRSETPLKIALLVAFTLLGGIFLFSPQASAVSNAFPNSSTASVDNSSNPTYYNTTGNVQAVVGNSGTYNLYDKSGNVLTQRGEGLFDSYADFEVAIPSWMYGSQSHYTVTIKNACWILSDNRGWEDHGYDPTAQLNGTNNSVGSDIQATDYKINTTTGFLRSPTSGKISKTCSGNGTNPDLVLKIPQGDFNLNPRFGTAFYSVIVEIYKTSKPGKKAFSVSAQPGMLVSFANLSPWPAGSGTGGGTYSPTCPGGPPCDPNVSFYAMNLQDVRSDYDTFTKWPPCNGTPNGTCTPYGEMNVKYNPPADYKFNFTPDCTYNGTKTVYLKWYRGSGVLGVTQTTPNENWKLTDSSGNVIAQHATSGDGQGFQFYPLPPLTPGTTYTWTWYNVDRAHGLTAFLPFSEITSSAGFSYSAFCSPPPSWSLSASSWVNTNAVTSKGGSYAVTSGYSVLFTHTIVNNGPSNASYTWQVLGSYNGNGFTPNHCGDHGTGEPTTYNASGSTAGRTCPRRVGTLDNNTVPNVAYDGSPCTGFNGPPGCRTQAEWYQFPSNANYGDTYCQQIEYWWQSSNNPAPGFSSPVCVTYSPPTTTASCAVTGIVGPGPSGIVLANQRFTVNVNLTNTGSLPLTNNNGLGIYSGDTANGFNAYDHLAPGYNSGASWGNDSFGWPGQGGVPGGTSVLMPGQSVTISVVLNAPIGVTTVPYTPNFAHPGQWFTSWTGGNAGIPACPLPAFNVYQHFTVTPNTISASLVPFEEDPTSVNNTVGFTVSEDNGGNATLNDFIDGPLTYTTANCGNATVIDSGGAAWSVGTTNLYGPSPQYNYKACSRSTAGDQYCAGLNVGYTDGYIGPGGGGVGPNQDLYYVTSTPISPNCPSVHNDPFFKVYGSGVLAGGDFKAHNPACSGGGDLNSWNNHDTGTYPNYDFGSSAQFTALALNNIVGFASAQAMGNPGRSPTDLSFSNTVNVGGADPYSPNLGGQFNYSTCLTDEDPKPGSPVLSGNQTIPATTINPGQNISEFVNGDVYISGNITYAGSGGSWTMGNVPSFVLHATGNIYIDPSVTELDGLYISNNQNGSGGNIYTCALGFSPMPAASLYGSCNNQLIIYGAFEADNVDLMRTYGSLRDEKPNPGSPPTPRVASPCSNAGAVSSSQTCAAEVFDFSPELYLATPGVEPAGNGAPQIQAITSLPPVF